MIATGSSPQPPLISNGSTPTSESYEHVGRQAWIILWTGFIVFVLLITGVPLALNWYIHNATTPQPAQMVTIRGTAIVTEPGADDEVGVTDTRPVRERTLIRTNDGSRANLSILANPASADSLATVQLRENSELMFQRARTPRFQRSELADRLDLRLNRGRVRVSGNGSGERPQNVTVTTPHAIIRFGDGEAVIAADSDQTEVSVRGGEVAVEGQNHTVVLNNGQRTVIAKNQPPSDPLPGAINLVQNGDFSQPLEGTWEVRKVVDAKDTSNATYGKALITEHGGRRAAYFERQGEEGVHTETAIYQPMDVDVLDFDSLNFRVDARLISQSLPGAGYLSSEYPLMVRIDYIDVNGNPQFWTWGFYHDDPEQNWPIRNGEKIPNFVWVEYESENFLDSPTLPRPQKITGITVYASGHNYQSMASGVGLIAK